jgi:magnesium chelatase subunit D
MIVSRLFALDPHGFGGVVVRAAAGPVRDLWLTGLIRQLGAESRCYKLPCNIDDDGLLGGLDLAATLRTGRPVQREGLLAQAHNGVVLCSMAERLPAFIAARIARVLDDEAVGRTTSKFAQPTTACIGVVALDEGVEPDERLPEVLAERMAFHIDLTGIALRDAEAVFGSAQADNFSDVRNCFGKVDVSDEVIGALCAAALMLGIGSLRAPLHAIRAARALAALEGRTECTTEDAEYAARLVLAPRARCIPAAPQGDEANIQESEPPANAQDNGEAQSNKSDAGELQEQVLSAAQAAIPPALLAALVSGQARTRGALRGRAGLIQASSQHGRVTGVKRATVRRGTRLNILETLRSAVPWQKLRERSPTNQYARIVIYPEDFRVNRYAQRTQTTTVIAIDASGSSALHRMAEAKGAIELLLAQCYVRRDQVAVVAFRGRSAELLLPPTRSLARAKRSLAGLPGGGATPLAQGIEAALSVADAARRKGTTPTIVLLTDGHANMSRDGVGGRTKAQADALRAADQVRSAGIAGLLIDTSPQPQHVAFEIAHRMGARYLPLPHANAKGVADAVRAAGAG